MRVLYWSPRVLSICFAVFISLFALDVFGEGNGFWETLLALAIHLVPTYIIVLCIWLAWRREWIGALGFAGLGIAYIIMSGGRQHWMAYVIISGPLFLLAGLYLWNWLWRGGMKSGA